MTGLNKTILIVDDEERMREMLRVILENRGFSIFEASNGDEALRAFRAIQPDMVILDVMMPVLDGFEALSEIRKSSLCPIIMLTAKGEDYDQVEGLEKGADDYIIKPFTPMVLISRIEAVFRRTADRKTTNDRFGDIRIDVKARSVYVGTDQVQLNRKEFDLLFTLTANHDISLSRDQLLEKVWGYDYLGSDSTVDTHVNRLRNKLGKSGSYIKTIRGYGYKFEV
jgi:two-component system response regulator ResD